MMKNNYVIGFEMPVPFSQWQDRHFNQIARWIKYNEAELSRHWNTTTLLDIAEAYIETLEEKQSLIYTIDEIADLYIEQMDVTDLYKDL